MLTSVTKMYGDVRIAEQQKVRKQETDFGSLATSGAVLLR